jgi:transposase
LVAIDISKERHDVLLELPDGRRKGFRISNHKADFDRFAAYLSVLELPCHIAFEATGDYHRILANFLHTQGFKLHLVSSIATARTREALYNTWDKNDAKDAKVILHLLKTGATQIYHDPLIHNYNDLQENRKHLPAGQSAQDKAAAQHFESLPAALLSRGATLLP